ncbi:8079_t:CDS:2, partial [Racocetra persica]
FFGILTGVPLIRPAAGIALGLFAGQIYTDINGLEDRLGEMDFKIAGTENGICSCQLDVKNQGINHEIFKESLVKGRTARLAILQEMKKYIYQPRPSLPVQQTANKYCGVPLNFLKKEKSVVTWRTKTTKGPIWFPYNNLSKKRVCLPQLIEFWEKGLGEKKLNFLAIADYYPYAIGEFLHRCKEKKIKPV